MGPLSNPAVIRLVSENVVPVAVNLYTIREDKGPAGDFFRKLNSQFVQYQGLYLAAPDGKLLVKKQMWTSENVQAGLEEGLRAFGPVKPRHGHSEYLARRGCGVDRDGGVILWDGQSGERLRAWRLPGAVNAVAWAPDSRHLALANGNGTIYILRLAPAATNPGVSVVRSTASWIALRAPHTQPPAEVTRACCRLNRAWRGSLFSR